jgi:ABC-type nitrate/sulfonate/bicarbonate transport system permease component
MFGLSDLKPSSQFTNVFRPNGRTTPADMRLVKAAWIAVFLIFWVGVKIDFIPQPRDLWDAFQHLWNIDALGIAVGESLELYFKSMIVGALIAGALAFSTVLPVFRPPIELLTRLRFLSMAGANLFFLIFFGSGGTLKFVMMIFYQTIAITKSLVDTIETIDKKYYDHARTIYKSEWAVAYEVIIKGKMADFIANVRANQPAGWTMLFIVEGFQTSGGGVGALMMRLMHHPVLAQVMVLLMLCVFAGLLLDLSWSKLRKLFCPYADFKSER